MKLTTKTRTIIGVVALLLFFVVAIAGSMRKSDVIATKEPEKGGPKAVALENTGKVGALYNADGFYFIKKSLSDYILSVNPDADSASVESVIIDNNSTAHIIVKNKDSKATIEALVKTDGDRMYFGVPADDYEKSNVLEDR